MMRRESPELLEEKRMVAEINASNREITSQLQNHYRELTERIRKQTVLWETDARISQERESEYMTLLRAVTSAQREVVRLLMERVDEQKQLQQLRSETSERDRAAMLSLYKKLRAFGVTEAEVKPRLWELQQACEEAVEKLEAFVEGLVK
jgi:serine phosphatase RsbU (regulator of sigma subunit)